MARFGVVASFALFVASSFALAQIQPAPIQRDPQAVAILMVGQS